VSVSKTIPTSETDLRFLALKRARETFTRDTGDFGVGFSEGIVYTRDDYFVTVWCVVARPTGEYGSTSSLYARLPPLLRERFLAGLLTESELEAFVSEASNNPYEQLIEVALNNLLLQRI